ncbi:hypothetical protein K435DRAFT_629632, partial [Dendrothele bispora CBS 962.96]
LSGEKVSRLIVPWARSPAERDVSVLAQSFNHRIAQAVSVLDATIMSESIKLLNPGHPHAYKFLTTSTTLIVLSTCARTALRDATAYKVLDQSRISLGTIELYRGVLYRQWSGDMAFEIERLTVGGLALIAYAAECKPTLNRSKKVNPADYKPLHAKPYCTCGFVKPSVSDIKNLLENGRIPVVVMDGDKLRVCDSTNHPYIAISHVWADGLGSMTEVGLPRCQITRIANLARQVVAGGAFWLDALCVPEDKTARKRAIELMAKTYEMAEKVLVTDGGIREQCSLSSPKEDLLLRITTSGWMQRIWTLQEGVLARELVFEVSNGVVDITHFSGASYTIALKVLAFLQHRPHDEAKQKVGQICPTPPRCNFNDLIPLLRHRKTSKPEDEPIAVAGVLGVSSSSLVAIHGLENRMRELLLQCRTIPRSVAVTGWNSKKLALPGFSWAPASVSEILWGTEWPDPFSAQVTPDGLRALYTVIRFPDT